MAEAWPGSETALRARLAAARDALHLNQEEVGLRIGRATGRPKGISDALVGHYETGERPLKYTDLRAHLRALNLPESWADDWVEWSVEERVVVAAGDLRQTERGPLSPQSLDALRQTFRMYIKGR